MGLLDWLARERTLPPPRSYAEIRAAIEAREAHATRRLNETEESLLNLTAEAGLEDLRRRLEALRRG